MEVQFVKRIPDGFSHIKGMREPLYGDNNEIIGFTEAGNGEVKPTLYIVTDKTGQLKKYHPQKYEFAQTWLAINLSTRIRAITIQRNNIRDELNKLDNLLFEVDSLVLWLKATTGAK